MRVIRCIAAAAFLFASGAHAALISVTADVGWSCGTGTGGFESGCTPQVEWGKMNLVYNTSVSDSDASSTHGAYSGAIVAFTMTVEQQSRPDLFFTLAPGPNAFEVWTGNGDKAFSISLTAQDQSGAYGYVGFRLNGYRTGLLLPDDLIYSTSDWAKAIGYVASAYTGPPAADWVSETDWSTGFRAVTLVSTADTLALLLGGAVPLFAGALVRRRVAGDRGLRR